MTQQDNSHLQIEDRGATLIVRVDGGPHSLFGLDIANELDELVDRVDRDPSVHAVVFTGARPGRFVSHADVRWLQEGGAVNPKLGPTQRLGRPAAGQKHGPRRRPRAGCATKLRCREPASSTACTRRS